MRAEISESINVDDAVFFSATLTADNPYISSKPRNHDSFAFVTDGTLGYEKEGTLKLIKKGQVAYIAKNATDKSSAYHCASVSYIAVNFNFDANNILSNPIFPFKTCCSGKNAYKYGRLFEEAIYEYNLNLQGSKLICNGLLYQIIGLLYHDFIFDNINGKMANKIEIALDYLNQNFQRSDLKVSEFAAQVGMSEKHFRRLFFGVYNKKPHEFLKDFRLNKARLLILNTSKSISDIAIQCGFSDVYSFSHCFKREFGISPKMYRETQALYKGIE